MKSRSDAKKYRQFEAEFTRLIETEFQRLYGSDCNLSENSRLSLNLTITSDDKVSVKFVPDLQQQVRDRLRDLNIQTGAYQPGNVYCFLHESSNCPHCIPSSDSHVMSGYQPNGVPEWDELLDVLIDEAPEKAASYYSNKNLIMTGYIKGRNLKKRLLSSFGKSSRTYNILGQVVMGFLYYRPSLISDEKITGVALTVQAVEHQLSVGRIGLDINVISGSNEKNILDYLADGPFQQIRSAIIQAKRQIKEIEYQINGATSENRTKKRQEFMPQIPTILREIAAEASRINRQRQRRTLHAQERKEDKRPVFKAIEDALNVNRAEVLEDPQSKAILIPGKRMRWHVFSRDGRLITSLYLDKEQVHRRIVRKRWQPPSDERISAFFQQLNRRLNTD